MRKATENERAEYAATKPTPLYPLGYYMIIDGERCAVEDLRGTWSRRDPQWEIMAPPGFRFSDSGCHTILEYTLADVRYYAGDRLVRCKPGDDCGCGIALGQTWTPGEKIALAITETARRERR